MRSPLTELLAEPRLERMAHFNDDRELLVALTVQRVVDQKRLALKDPRGLELVLNEVCFMEAQRFRSQKKLDDDDKRLRGRLAKIRKSLRRMSSAELIETTTSLTRFYARDIVGNFNPAVYAFASRAAPVLLSLLFSPFKLGRSVADLSQLRERIHIEGQIADLMRLARTGTLILTPTHLSNLDSIAIGFALERTALPPVTYGAGKNLFENPLLAFFMRNLGAYRVDRRIRHDLYKDTLKTYSAVLLERGYHSLFFPGGTRSRSGAIESKVKLGLLGTALEASINLLRRGENRPIYVVPATINYTLVLEAATLIDDWLKERGQHRYIIDDDESTQLSKVVRYLSDTLRAEQSLTIHLSEPLDVLGHHVAPDGTSLVARGRSVELKDFVTVHGEVKHDAMRDAEYTRELADRITDRFRADTHVLSTHLVAFVLFRALAKQARSEELFRIIRGGEEKDPLVAKEVLASIARTVDALKALAVKHKIRLGLKVSSATPSGSSASARRDHSVTRVPRRWATAASARPNAPPPMMEALASLTSPPPAHSPAGGCGSSSTAGDPRRSRCRPRAAPPGGCETA